MVEISKQRSDIDIHYINIQHSNENIEKKAYKYITTQDRSTTEIETCQPTYAQYMSKDAKIHKM